MDVLFKGEGVIAPRSGRVPLRDPQRADGGRRMWLELNPARRKIAGSRGASSP